MTERIFGRIIRLLFEYTAGLYQSFDRFRFSPRHKKKVSLAAGKILPASKEDFSLTKKTFPDYTINFKSGTAKSWVDDRGHVCLVVDGVTTEGKKIKLSVRSSYE